MTTYSLFPLVTRASMTMVLADASVDRTNLPLAAMTDMLAETIRVELDDLVWVLHVVWDVGPAPMSSPPSEIRVPLAANVTTFVHGALVDFCADWGIAFDQVLIEASGIDPTGSLNAALWAAMVDLPCTACVDYMVDDPEAWNTLPLTIGILPLVTVQPVVLLGPLPEAHVVKTLLIELLGILNSMNPGQAAQQWVVDAINTGRITAWIRRWLSVVSQMYGSTALRPPAWPLDAVRLRFEGDPALVLPTPIETNVESYGRWARTVTQRRVGLAIGGAGAQSYVGIPFIEQLTDAGVPIDIMSGSSTGAFITAFYAALGDKGLLRMLLNSNTIGWGVFFALINNMPLTWWLAWATHYVDLGELAQPVVSVATSADKGDAIHMTSGLAGKSLMASGSMPPFVATYIGNSRLLDGGLSQDVPTAVLNSAGASLVVAAQSIPKIMTIPTLPDFVPVPYLTKYAITLNPFVRVLDYYRGFITLFRQAAFSQEKYAQVFYSATTQFSSAGTWFAGPRIAHEAALSQALQDAVAESVAYWNELLADAPGRVRINRTTNLVEIGWAVEIGYVFDEGLQAWRLTSDAGRIVVEIGKYVASFASALAVTLRYPPGVPQLPEHQTLVITASGLPITQVVFTAPIIEPLLAETTFDLAVVP
ncbi:patatin-like phospholipase family protein [Nannocystaceae bacterium ST9]